MPKFFFRIWKLNIYRMTNVFNECEFIMNWDIYYKLSNFR